MRETASTRKNVGESRGPASSWRRRWAAVTLREFEMRYLLLLHVDESGWPSLTLSATIKSELMGDFQEP